MSDLNVHGLFAKRDDPYAGADVIAVRRLGGLLWLVTLLLTLAVTPLAPPTAHLDSAGWAVAAGLATLSLGVAWAQLRPGSKAGFGGALAMAYAGLAVVVTFQLLAGPNHGPYHELYMVWAVFVSVSQPPRRAALYLVAVAAAAFSPLALEGFSGVAAVDLAVQMAIWAALSLVGMLWMNGVRANRVAAHEQEQQAIRLARVDPLTGLPNRRAFDEALEVEVARAARTGKPLSVVVGDLDGFKEINDAYGHLSGDRALRQAAGALRSALRRSDSCFRWGGDEFALLLPGSNQAGADEAGERAAAAVAACTRPDGRPLRLAFGCAELTDAMTLEDLLAQADLAMMTLKAERSDARVIARAVRRAAGA